MNRLISSVAKNLGLAFLVEADFQLIRAIRSNQLISARRALLLGARAQADTLNPLSFPCGDPLEEALYRARGDASMVRLLLDAGSIPDHWTDPAARSSPIHVALERGQWEAAELLMSRAQRPFQPSIEGQSVLGSILSTVSHHAAGEDNGAANALLRALRSGADPFEPAIASSSYRLSATIPFHHEGDPVFLLACFIAGSTGRADPALALLGAGLDPAVQNAKGHGAASFFFLGLQHNRDSYRLGADINPSQWTLITALAAARLPLAFSATLAGFGPESTEELAVKVWRRVAAIEQSVAERDAIDSIVPALAEPALTSAPKPSRRL